MAPREAKAIPKARQVIPKTNTTKKLGRMSISDPATIKKTMSTRKVTEQTPLKANNAKVDSRQRVNTVPATPKPKENKAVPCPGSVTKSAKKSWKRRPKPAHSGVPVPEKMKKLLQQRLLDSDRSF